MYDAGCSVISGKQLTRFIVFTGFLLFAAASASEDTQLSPVLTQIQADCSTLGPDWQGEYGLRIDNLSDLRELSKNEREVARTLRDQVQPLGIVGVADYSCAKLDAPLDIVTVRVFVFSSVALASDWWEGKYLYEGWEKHYVKPEIAKHAALDSTQTAKRALLAHNLWLTSHHVQSGDEHLTLLEHILDQLGVE